MSTSSGLLHRRRHTPEPAHRAQAHVEVQELAQGHVERAETAAHRRRERALDADQVLAEHPERLVGQPVAGLLERLLSSEDFRPGDPAPLPCLADGGVDYALRRRPDVHARPVALDERDDGFGGDVQLAVGPIVIFSAMGRQPRRGLPGLPSRPPAPGAQPFVSRTWVVSLMLPPAPLPPPPPARPGADRPAARHAAPFGAQPFAPEPFPTEPVTGQPSPSAAAKPGSVPEGVILADNLGVLRAMPDGCIDLVYIDPPFGTGQVRRLDTMRTGAAKGQDRVRRAAVTVRGGLLLRLPRRYVARGVPRRSFGSALSRSTASFARRARSTSISTSTLATTPVSSLTSSLAPNASSTR